MDLVAKIWNYCQKQGYKLATAPREYEIIYIEGADADGKPNTDRIDEWNDRRLVIQFRPDGTGTILGNWDATTEPGRYYTDKPMNPKGAARIAFGRYKAWTIGTHGNSQPHRALVQCGIIKVHRDINKDGLRIGDPIDAGAYFGINQHWGYDLPRVGTASAGCLVGKARNGHREFMQLIDDDIRLERNPDYIYWSTIIPGDQL